MSNTLLQSYLTNLRLTLQGKEYTRLNEVPKLAELGEYIRIKADGYLEAFISDSNVEFLQGEILIVLNKELPILSTVYRNTKPNGSIVKHENFDVTSFWQFFTLPENYSKGHVNTTIKLIETELSEKFYSFDIRNTANNLSIAFAQANSRLGDDPTDSNKLMLDKVLELRDKVIMRLAYELNNEKAQLLPVAAHRVPFNEELFSKLKVCPWLSPENLSDIIKATTRDNQAYIHPYIFNFVNLFKFVYIKSDTSRFVITTNKIYDVTNVAEKIPRFFEYVK